MLVGQEEQEHAFLTAWRSGQMHHAWLLTGPRGVGKAGFARTVARFVLARAASHEADAGTLDVDADEPAARLMAAGSHPDLRLLERLPRRRDEQLAAAIVVDQVRELQPFLQSRPSLSDWRVVVIDSADDLNRAAANALLKNLEEPPAGTLFLLVSHAPGRLLPTIRSRCRRLGFTPLADAQVRDILREARPDLPPGDLEPVVRAAGGAPGRALSLADAGAADLIRAIDGIATSHEGSALGAAARLARSLGQKDAQQRFEALLELVPAFIARAASRSSGPRLAAAIELWDKAHALSGQAVALALDPQAVALELLCLINALKLEEDARAER